MPAPPSPTSDFPHLLESAQQGDPQALEQLFERFYPRVKAMVHRSLASDLRLKRPWIATLFSTGDVVQEVFQNVLRNLEAAQCATEDAFAGYLARIVRNRLIDAIRFHEAARRDRRLANVALDDVEPESDAEGPTARITTEEELGIFLRVLQTFSQREQLLLRERMERGESFPQLAELLGFPSADAARKAYYSAQALLLVRLKAHGMEAP